MPGRFRFRHILEVDQVAVGWQLVQWEFGDGVCSSCLQYTLRAVCSSDIMRHLQLLCLGWLYQ